MELGSLAAREADKALQALVVDNPDLERLELLLEEFNIFEVLRAVRWEARHSDFVAYLLDPNQNHGLGDAFLKRLLQKALPVGGSFGTKISPVLLDVWSLDQALVLREWQGIDILVLDDLNRLVVIIENKIDSTEHSNQLQRYYEAVQRQHPQHSIVGLLLSPDRQVPSDDHYIAVDYRLVLVLVEGLLEARSGTLGSDVRTLMAHYARMLRRHIVNDSEIPELCRQLYRKHQRACDLIFQYRPDIQYQIAEQLKSLITEQSDLELDHCSKSYVRFISKGWDSQALKSGAGWTPSGRMLLFEFFNGPDQLKLSLIIGPGPQDVRQRLFDMATAAPSMFRPSFRTLNKAWNTIWTLQCLKKQDYENKDSEQLVQEIKRQWDRFVKHNLPEISKALKGQTWLYESQLQGQPS